MAYYDDDARDGDDNDDDWNHGNFDRQLHKPSLW